MILSIDLDVKQTANPITYKDRVLSIGSCFAENIASKLNVYKFDTFCNPHGILFSPVSVASSLLNCIENRIYTEDDLFYQNELWNSWEHHTRFSDIDQQAALDKINSSVASAHQYLKEASHLIITLGTGYQYYNVDTGEPVSNNHKTPADKFEKVLLPAEEVFTSLAEAIDSLLSINPKINIILTVSPVRHLRDGVINNNRSKARLIEGVHQLCNEYEQAYYFPAYELVVDVLRDYRFYDADMAHPNSLAVDYVWEQFCNACISEEAKSLMSTIKEIVSAYNHRPRFPQTDAHQKFLATNAQKVQKIIDQHPYLDLSKELAYFNNVE